MKKTLFTAAALICLFIATSISTAKAEMYISPNIGLSMLSDSSFSTSVDSGKISYDSGLSFGLAVGSRIEKNIRLEVEGFYKKNDLNEVKGETIDYYYSYDASSSVSALGIMTNFYIDLLPSEKITPFIGVGLGFVNVDFDTVGSDSGPAYQMIAGVSFNVSEKTSIDFSYRYLSIFSDMSLSSYGDTIEIDYKSNTVQLGLRYSF